MDSNILGIQNELNISRRSVLQAVSEHNSEIASIQNEILSGVYAGWDDPAFQELLSGIQKSVDRAGAVIEQAVVEMDRRLVAAMREGLNVQSVINITNFLVEALHTIRSLTVTLNGSDQREYVAGERLLQVRDRVLRIRREIPLCARQDLEEECGSLLNRQAVLRRRLRSAQENLIQAQTVYEAALRSAREQKEYVHSREDSTLNRLESDYGKIDRQIHELQIQLEMVRQDQSELNFFTEDRRYALEEEEDHLRADIELLRQKAAPAKSRARRARSDLQKRLDSIDLGPEEPRRAVESAQAAVDRIRQQLAASERAFDEKQDALDRLIIPQEMKFDSRRVIVEICGPEIPAQAALETSLKDEPIDVDYVEAPADSGDDSCPGAASGFSEPPLRTKPEDEPEKEEPLDRRTSPVVHAVPVQLKRMEYLAEENSASSAVYSGSSGKAVSSYSFQEMEEDSTQVPANPKRSLRTLEDELQLLMQESGIPADAGVRRTTQADRARSAADARFLRRKTDSSDGGEGLHYAFGGRKPDTPPQAAGHDFTSL